MKKKCEKSVKLKMTIESSSGPKNCHYDNVIMYVCVCVVYLYVLYLKDTTLNACTIFYFTDNDKRMRWFNQGNGCTCK